MFSFLPSTHGPKHGRCECASTRSHSASIRKTFTRMFVDVSQKNVYRFGLLVAHRTNAKQEFIARFAFLLWFYFLIHLFWFVFLFLVFCAVRYLFSCFFSPSFLLACQSAAAAVAAVEIRKLRTLHKIYYHICAVGTYSMDHAITYYYYPLLHITVRWLASST